MKRWMAALLLLCVLLGACPARTEAMTPGAWQRVRLALLEDGNDPVPAEYRIAAKPLPWFAPWPQAGFQTILLLSTDAPDIRQNFGRAGVALLCTVELSTGKTRLLSLPEQGNVALPGVPEPIWLKFVNCFGGPMLMMETLTETLGLPVNRYCAVNLNAFVRTLDQLGGVTVTLTEDEADALGLEPGKQLLTGDQTLRYVRFRWGDRVGRIRGLVDSVSRQVLGGASLHDGFTLLDFLITAIDTNLTTDDLVDTVYAVLDQEQRPAVSFRSVDTLDAEALQRGLAFLYGREDAP